MDLIVLTFVAGFAVATLIFWPLLQKAQRRPVQPPPVPRTPKHRKTTQSSPVVVPRQTAPAEQEPKKKETAEPVVSIGYAPEAVEMPELPTDLFAKRYEARFNRTRRRLERLRAQVEES
ncbi:hypothetical protein [Saccharopolyspora taberi]|uniref:Uncharacterized protein n=1 Tax=Saccharopolyspora taberi TaxID=60895 RepID=A0ABN3VP78_9PSEU